MTGRYGLKSVPLQEREDEADVGSVVARLQKIWKWEGRDVEDKDTEG